MSWMTAPGMVASRCQGFASGPTRAGAGCPTSAAGRVPPSALDGPITGTRPDTNRTLPSDRAADAPVDGAATSSSNAVDTTTDHSVLLATIRMLLLLGAPMAHVSRRSSPHATSLQTFRFGIDCGQQG